ncbi:MAG TPA: hypothetical protein VNZ86_05475, partial [Bacteroidia bacterium]|nr:hypothetical protein [Bacteroidia bacterium]
IQFNYTGNPYPSLQEQQKDKTFFLDKLGPFKDEFDAKDGIVTFNYSYQDTDNNRIAFVLGKTTRAGELSDFIIRWNEYIRGLQGNAS